MASEADLINTAGVVAVVIVGMLLARMMANRSPRPSQPTPLGSASMLGRYATHRGHVVGEVVAITTDRLVLRQAGVHKAVPLSQAKQRDGEVVVEGEVDWTAAEDAGKAWAAAATPAATDEA